MKDFLWDSSKKSSKNIRVNNIYNQQGQDFESILGKAIKNILIAGRIPQVLSGSKKETVELNGQKEEEL